MLEFVKMSNIDNTGPVDYWYLKITNIDQFTKYCTFITHQAAEAFGKIYDSLARDNVHCPWISDSLKMGLWKLSYARAIRTGEFSLAAYTGMVQESLDAKLKVMREDGAIYVGKSGGFFSTNPYLKKVESVFSEDVVFPDDTHKELVAIISSWEGGQHFYLSVNGTHIICDGMDKWDSYLKAWNAINTYMHDHYKKEKYQIKREVKRFIHTTGD